MGRAKMMRKALVLGRDNRSFLSVIRSLGRAGIEVHVGWHEPGGPAARSRFIAKAHDLPSYDDRDDRWKTELIALVTREQYDLVIPCHDSNVVPLQKHRSDLEPHGRFYLLNDEAFRVGFDKFRTGELARSVGVRTPREVILTGPEGIERVAAEFQLPVILKPRASFNPETPESLQAVRRVDTWEAFQGCFAAMIEAGPVAVQELFIGRGVGVELLLDAGEPLMAFQHRRLHELPHGGCGTYRESVPLTPALLDAALRLLRPLRYTGVAMVEFRVEPRTGDWVLLEVNGRFWGSLPLAVAAGADFPLALFRFLVEGRTEFSRVYRVGICCRNWETDVDWLCANFRADRSDPTLATSPLPLVAIEALKNVIQLRERSDTFTLDDPAPAWAELVQIACRMWRRLRWKLAARRWRQPASRDRLRRRARASLRRAGRILFVCQGNICRSPFAAALLRGQSPVGLAVESAGYLPRPGRLSPDAALAVAASRGVDLSAHRSQVLTVAMVRRADAILVFDQADYREVISAYPFARDHVHLLGVLRPDGPIFIDDPWGGPRDAFERCYREIAELIPELSESIGHPVGPAPAGASLGIERPNPA